MYVDEAYVCSSTYMHRVTRSLKCVRMPESKPQKGQVIIDVLCLILACPASPVPMSGRGHPDRKEEERRAEKEATVFSDRKKQEKQGSVRPDFGALERPGDKEAKSGHTTRLSLSYFCFFSGEIEVRSPVPI